jgi:hypothetical protein
MMTKEQSHNYLKYYSLCNFMCDFIDDKWEHSSTNVRRVKMLTNQLKVELEKSVDHVFTNKNTDGVDMGNVLEQFVNAANCMNFFFEIGLFLDELPYDRKHELNKRINDLLLEYNIDLKTNINNGLDS